MLEYISKVRTELDETQIVDTNKDKDLFGNISRVTVISTLETVYSLLEKVPLLDRSSSESSSLARDTLNEILDHLDLLADSDKVCITSISAEIEIVMKDKIFNLEKLHQDIAKFRDSGKLTTSETYWLNSHAKLPSLSDFDVLKMISKGAYGFGFLI